MVQHLERRSQQGKHFSVIVVSEGVHLPDLKTYDVGRERDEFGHERLDRRGVGDSLARAIEQRTGMETRVTVLGHIQRGGSPNPTDRVWATRLGVTAVDWAHQGRTGVLVGVQKGEIVPVPLGEIAGKTRTVDLALYKLALGFE